VNRSVAAALLSPAESVAITEMASCAIVITLRLYVS
jgi:hypothetical protein